MKIFIIFLVIISSSFAYAGEPYVKYFNKGENWTVLEVGIAGEFKQCALRSPPFYLDNNKDPKYGTTFLEISYPSNNITFSGENIGAYFKISKHAKLQIDDGADISITPETPFSGESIIDKMKKGMTAKITMDFGGGPTDIHTFSLSGFTAAYSMLPACSGVSAVKHTVVETPSGTPKKTMTLGSFLKSGFAKHYGISKEDGWALKNGLFNNELSISHMQGVMLSVSTKKENILEAGIMFLGTSNLDASKMSFVMELFRTLDPSTSKLQIKEAISRGLLNRVSQINQSAIQTYGKLQVRTGNVGGDAVISIKIQ